ncbi:ImmA/IrrE family metallo-endopeptidase [Paenibacillus larvae]|uniref:IrrE N-terminal-like domain-containing protein n=2 Tax=Paenibacillus larvae subsp. larvae TaxID=147375 RepID=V9W112_9BACL|nr:ImmA/IrrE family metallo-endopeptidase [Paenibacillus larvae]AHD04676.1 hypothetical protein ERIC2_c08430 [Paenibacillus larvae subsp. larvae DSM 25430]MDR5566989.1 ImmA/IrrE family metallo-endopeptidase [Paenibacillus larvae]MDR5595016.1 ImmA/IrrE family metallo-endopeptidase [Paenibacillus larvae]
MKIALIAQKIIQTHGTNDPLRIAEEKNIKVLFEDLGENIWGYYTCLYRTPSVHVNNRLNDFEARFSIAHELSHHILHQGINTPFLKKNTLFSIDKIEREANELALYILIGNNKPEYGETKECFLFRCGIPEEFHVFYY